MPTAVVGNNEALFEGGPSSGGLSTFLPNASTLTSPVEHGGSASSENSKRKFHGQHIHVKGDPFWEKVQFSAKKIELLVPDCSTFFTLHNDVTRPLETVQPVWL